MTDVADRERRFRLDRQLRRALGSAVGLIALALASLIAAGEIWIGREGVSTPEVAGAWGFVLHGVSTPWAQRLWTILAWDLLLGAVMLWLMREAPPHPHPLPQNPGGEGVAKCPSASISPASSFRWEALLGLGVTGTLWRLVFLSGLALATGPGAEWVLSGRRDLLALWLTVGLVLVGKERLARSLEASDRREPSVLLGALAWHHRKDGVFSVLLALALTWGFLGGSAGRADLVLNLVKILLLGGSAEKLTRRCVRELCHPPGEQQP